MDRRTLLKTSFATAGAIALPLNGLLAGQGKIRRLRPGHLGWPTEAEWQRLNVAVGNRLLQPVSPLLECGSAPGCSAVFQNLRNPYFIRDNPALTQSLGWAGAWTSQPSTYAVAAESAADVAAAVHFANRH